MVEPRRRCLSLPAVDLRKKAVGGIIYVTVVSGSKLPRSAFRASPSRRSQSFHNDYSLEDHLDDRDMQTFVEVELEDLFRRTEVKRGSSPRWNSMFNMVLHEDVGNLRFSLYECIPNSVKYDYVASCEIKVINKFCLLISVCTFNTDSHVYNINFCTWCLFSSKLKNGNSMQRK